MEVKIYEKINLLPNLRNSTIEKQFLDNFLGSSYNSWNSSTAPRLSTPIQIP